MLSYLFIKKISILHWYNIHRIKIFRYYIEMPGKTFRQKPRSKNNKKSKKNHSNNKKSRKQLKGGMKARTPNINKNKAIREEVQAIMREYRSDDSNSSVVALEKADKLLNSKYKDFGALAYLQFISDKFPHNYEWLRYLREKLKDVNVSEKTRGIIDDAFENWNSEDRDAVIDIRDNHPNISDDNADHVYNAINFDSGLPFNKAEYERDQAKADFAKRQPARVQARQEEAVARHDNEMKELNQSLDERRAQRDEKEKADAKISYDKRLLDMIESETPIYMDWYGQVIDHMTAWKAQVFGVLTEKTGEPAEWEEAELRAIIDIEHHIRNQKQKDERARLYAEQNNYQTPSVAQSACWEEVDIPILGVMELLLESYDRESHRVIYKAQDYETRTKKSKVKDKIEGLFSDRKMNKLGNFITKFRRAGEVYLEINELLVPWVIKIKITHGTLPSNFVPYKSFKRDVEAVARTELNRALEEDGDKELEREELKRLQQERDRIISEGEEISQEEFNGLSVEDQERWWTALGNRLGHPKK